MLTDNGGSDDCAFAKVGIPNDKIENANNKIVPEATIFI